jgi:hypothetical protein
VIAILSSRLLEQAPGSELHDKHRLQPTVFYWQNEFFENATTASRAGADVWHKPLMGACIRAGGRHRRWMMRGVRCRATSSMPREKAETPASGRFRLTDEVAYFRMAYNPFPFASLGFEAAARSSPRAVEEARNGSSPCSLVLRLCCPGTAPYVDTLSSGLPRNSASSLASGSATSVSVLPASTTGMGNAPASFNSTRRRSKT